MKTLLLILLMIGVNYGAYLFGWHIRDRQISVMVCQENLDR